MVRRSLTNFHMKTHKVVSNVGHTVFKLRSKPLKREIAIVCVNRPYMCITLILDVVSNRSKYFGFNRTIFFRKTDEIDPKRRHVVQCRRKMFNLRS